MYLSEIFCSSVQPALEKTQTFLVGQFFSVMALPRQHHLKESKPIARPQQICLSQKYFDLQYSSTLLIPNLLTSSSLHCCVRYIASDSRWRTAFSDSRSDRGCSTLASSLFQRLEGREGAIENIQIKRQNSRDFDGQGKDSKS